MGNNPDINANQQTMSGAGARINSDGKFALGGTSANIVYNGSTLYLNGEVIQKQNLVRGAALPDYMRTYKPSSFYSSVVVVDPVGAAFQNMNSATWSIIPMDTNALINSIGATDYSSTHIILPAGTYYYELSVPVKNNSSDTNDGVFTAIVTSTPGTTSVYGVIGYDYDGYPTYGYTDTPNPVTAVRSYAGGQVLGDWQTALVHGVGTFTLQSADYISAGIKTTENNNVTMVALPYASGIVLKIWRSVN